MNTSVRCGSGLGDSLYLRPFVEHFVRAEHEVTALTNYPEIFIGSGAKTEPFRRERATVVAHYIGGKGNPNTTIWDDLCAFAKVSPPFEFAWDVQNPALVESVTEAARGRPVVLVNGGREPMGRKDGFGRDLMPRHKAFLDVLNGLEGAFRVRIGKGNEIYNLPCDLDLTDKTSPADLLDLASSSAGIVAQCSFALPLAEALNRPLLVLWSSAGMASSNDFIRTITPRKMLTKPSSHYIMDNEGNRDFIASVWLNSLCPMEVAA